MKHGETGRGETLKEAREQMGRDGGGETGMYGRDASGRPNRRGGGKGQCQGWRGQGPAGHNVQ